MTTANISDEQLALFQQLQQFLAANVPTSSEKTISECIELFDSYNVSVGKRPKTRDWHLNAFKHFSEFYEGKLNQPISKLDQEVVDGYRLHLVRRSLAVESVNNYLRSLSAFLNWCHNRNYIKLRVTVEKVRGDPPSPKPTFDEGDFKALLKACDNESTILLRLRARAIVYTLISTGMRASELCHARWLDISHQKVDGKQAHILQIKGAKRGGDRKVILSPACWQAIIFYREDLSLPHGQGYKVEGLDPAWLFVSHRNYDEPLTPSGLYTLFKRLGKRAKVHANPHKFRHDFATRWLNKDEDENEDTEALLKLAGWKSREMLDIYTSIKPKTLVRAHRKHNRVRYNR